MKVAFSSILTCTFVLSAGCAPNSLVARLKDRGVTPVTTAKLKFVGTEADVGPDIYVAVEDPEVLKSVWTRIYSATPTKHWCACGFRRIEFYTGKKAERPTTVLLVNATDAAYVEGDYWHHFDSHREKYYGLARCPGLHKLVMSHLEEEYERQKDGA